MRQHHRYLPYVMWLLPLLFFGYQFILRLWPSLMMQQIMHQFAIDASSFGLLASLYYYGYAGMQIPIAMLLDRFSARYVIFSCASLCALATLVFTFSDNWYLACICRFFIGAGSAVGFLGVSKIVSQWFAKEHYARMIGFSFTLGLLGAIYGGKPINMLIEHYSWQNVALSLAGVALVIGLSVLAFLRAPTKNTVATTDIFKLRDFNALLGSPFIWLLAVANLLMVGSLEGFADVWGVPYLMAAYDIDKSQAAQLVSLIFVGMLFGGPLLAVLSRWLGNYPVIVCSGIGMVAAFAVLLASHTYHGYWLATIFFVIGILCCYQVIVFAAGSELVEAKLLGVTVAFLNCINMLGGSFFHTLVGLSMDMFWTGNVDAEGIRQYTLTSYQHALLVIPACALLGAAIVAYLGVKQQRQLKNAH